MTFQRVFGTCDWAVMFILARGGDTFCRLRVRSVGSPVGLSASIPVRVDYSRFGVNELVLPLPAWREQYQRAVRVEPEVAHGPDVRWWEHDSLLDEEEAGLDATAWLDRFEELDAGEQHAVLSELVEIHESNPQEADFEGVDDED